MKNAEKGKKLGKALLMGSALVSLSTPQQANAVTETGAMSALILAPISVSATQELHWGSMTVGATGDTVTIEPVLGARTQGGGGAVNLLTGGAVAPLRGQLLIGAATGLQIDITLGATADTVSNGAVTMAVNNFHLRTAAGGTQESVTITATTAPGVGTIVVGVGADLIVGAAQAPGTYTGAYDVDVNYN